MIHYLGYAADGQFLTIEICTNKWPDGFDIMSENPKHDLAKSLKTMRASHSPPIVGFVEWDCGAASGHNFGNQIHPACMLQHTHYYDIVNSVIQPKAVCNLLIDGQVKLTIDGSCVNQYPTINVPPGVVVELSLVGTCPDGSKVVLSNKDSVVSVLAVPTIELLFNDGISDAVEVLTPLQGMTSLLNFSGKYVCNVGFVLRGWPGS